MAFASGKAVKVLNVEMQSNKPDPVLYMGGVSASLVYNKTWGLSYQGEVGFARPLIALTTTQYTSTPPVDISLTGEASILRYDNSLSLTRLIGATGFGVFIGGKIQGFGYTQSEGRFITGSGGIVFQSFAFEGVRSILTYGPAAGLTYSRQLLQRIFASLQTGFIYFPGTYRNEIKVNMPGSANGTTLGQEKFFGLGFTAVLSLALPLTDIVLLQGAFRAQYYRTKTLEATITDASSGKVEPVSGGLDNTQDILLGIQVGAIFKVF